MPTAIATGKTTGDVLTSYVARNKDVSAVFVFPYEATPSIQDRLDLTKAEEKLIKRALGLREQLRLPFWDSVMLACFDAPLRRSRLFREAMRHQNRINTTERIGRSAVLNGALSGFSKQPHRTHDVAISSLIELEGRRSLHLPFLDFHCPESSENDRLVSEACAILFQQLTHVFASGKSYHAIGTQRMDESALVRFLGRAILLSPIVDARYAAHQLLERACGLRITASTVSPHIPTLKFTLPRRRKVTGAGA